MFASPAGLIAYFFSHLFLVTEFVTIVICVSLFIFLKLWKRKSNQLACTWGTIEAFELESARPAFRSKGMHRDLITDELVPFYPITKTWFKEYLISVPFVICCLYVSFKVMCIYFEIENWTMDLYNQDPSSLSSVVSYCPSIIYALLVMVMNHLYRHYATKLNDYGKCLYWSEWLHSFISNESFVETLENHRTQTSHENHWIVKLVLVYFCFFLLVSKLTTIFSFVVWIC